MCSDAARRKYLHSKLDSVWMDDNQTTDYVRAVAAAAAAVTTRNSMNDPKLDYGSGSHIGRQLQMIDVPAVGRPAEPG